MDPHFLGAFSLLGPNMSLTLQFGALWVQNVGPENKFALKLCGPMGHFMKSLKLYFLQICPKIGLSLIFVGLQLCGPYKILWALLRFCGPLKFYWLLKV